MNHKLKRAIVTSGKPSWRIAEAVGVHETVLSKIVHRRREASPVEQRRLAKALGCRVVDLFPVVTKA